MRFTQILHQANAAAKALPQSTGLVLGKFMPLHCGHEHLLDFANKFVGGNNNLHIVVDSIPNQPIPGEKRYQWLKQRYPDAKVIHLQHMPQEPQGNDDQPFWRLWRDTLLHHMSSKPRYVFSSEDYAIRLAHELGARHIPVDRLRTSVPISATLIRQSPLTNWSYISDVAKADLAKKICIMGPLCSGKGELITELCSIYGGLSVPEYAQTYLCEHSKTWREFGPISAQDYQECAKGQSANEHALAKHSNGLLFCNTGLLDNQTWFQKRFAKNDPVIASIIDYERPYDLVLLAHPFRKVQNYQPIPSIDDFIATLSQRGIQFTELKGTQAERKAIASIAVESLISHQSISTPTLGM